MSLFPILFIGHGSPMNAIHNNQYTQALQNIGLSLPKPKAILVISAHWESNGTLVHQSDHPRTIYDFGGFPQELYQIKYPCAGANQEIAQELINRNLAQPDHTWGLDHGAWTVLKHIYPKADIPCTQLSLDRKKTFSEHLKLAAQLRFLREKEVLILCSGNLIHHLGKITWQENATPFDWAVKIDEKIKIELEQRNISYFVDTWRKDASFRMAHPSNEHFLPLLYALGASDYQEEYHRIFDEIHHGSIAMRSFMIG
jgi:4,5-DOPA dioxygenase extradiol